MACCASGPSSLHPSLCVFSPSELIMRELYRPQHSVSLPHNTNNRGYHERREGSVLCTPSTNTRSHLLCAGESVFSLPVYFRLALCCEKSIRQKLMRNSFPFPRNKVLAVCYQNLWVCGVLCAIMQLAKTHKEKK